MITIKYTGDDEDFPWVVANSGESVAAYQTLEKAAESATTICYRLHRMGYGQVTPQHLSVWASRGNIKMEIRGNKPCYLLANVLEWVTREDKS